MHNGVQAEQSSAKKIISQSIVKRNCFENQSASIIVMFALKVFQHNFSLKLKTSVFNLLTSCSLQCLTSRDIWEFGMWKYL